MVCNEVIRARGHPNIKASHKTTLEITKEDFVTSRGDCIIGVSADKGAFDLSEDFKECLREEDSILVILLEAGDVRDLIVAQGHPSLPLSGRDKVIIRKSSYIEPSTIGIMANKAAADIKRELVSKLRDPTTTLIARLHVMRLREVTPIDPRSGRVL